ncbi:MAG TPA: hypothetical protein VIF81_11490 [Pyrinomonadaceae bacterium]
MIRSLFIIACIANSGLSVHAQDRTPPKPAKHTVVTAAQVNGVYRFDRSEFRILALGHNKLRVQFDGAYLTMAKSVNTGYASGEATIDGNVATLDLPEFGPCKINMVFLRNGKMKVTQEGSDADCGFGHNVYATGTYRKIRSGKPKFESPP